MLKIIEIGLISVNIVKFSNSENFQFIANQPKSLSRMALIPLRVSADVDSD
jgi:hypothetical protein